MAGRTSVAVLLACALALGAAVHAGATPLEGAGGDDVGRPTASTPDDIEPSTDDTDSPETSGDDEGSRDDEGFDRGFDEGSSESSEGSGSLRKGIDLDHPVTDRELRVVTDYLVFTATMRDFQHVRRQRLLSSQVTWDTRACDTPLRDSVGGFGQACDRREFGYRNFRRQDRFDTGLQERVDKRFKRELRAQCAGQDLVGRAACERKADLYFVAVN